MAHLEIGLFGAKNGVHMAAALTTISWLACFVALVPTIAMTMAIKFQEDRESKRAQGDIADGASYLRRYRFLWASIPMSFLLLALVALPTISCREQSKCVPEDTSTGLFVISIAVGLFAWSLTTSLLYNRYFYSNAERPFRVLVGTERLMWIAVRLLTVVTIVLAVLAFTRI